MVEENLSRRADYEARSAGVTLFSGEHRLPACRARLPAGCICAKRNSADDAPRGLRFAQRLASREVRGAAAADGQAGSLCSPECTGACMRPERHAARAADILFTTPRSPKTGWAGYV